VQSGFSLGLKRQEHEAENSHLSSVNIKMVKLCPTHFMFICLTSYGNRQSLQEEKKANSRNVVCNKTVMQELFIVKNKLVEFSETTFGSVLTPTK
jgi:hypothetical protein